MLTFDWVITKRLLQMFFVTHNVYVCVCVCVVFLVVRATAWFGRRRWSELLHYCSHHHCWLVRQDRTHQGSDRLLLCHSCRQVSESARLPVNHKQSSNVHKLWSHWVILLSTGYEFWWFLMAVGKQTPKIKFKFMNHRKYIPGINCISWAFIDGKALSYLHTWQQQQQQQQQQSFYSPLSGTTLVSRYQKKHSPTHHPIFISFFHLLRSIASSLFK